MKNRHLALALVASSLFTNGLSADETSTHRVSTRSLDSALVKVEQSAPATVVSLNQATISAQLAAKVEAVHVQVGDEVEQGDILVTLDCREARENKNIARASLTLAEQAARRARSLSRSSNISEQNLNEADATLKRAKAEHGLAKLGVEHCQIKAPYAGAVTMKKISQGELASVGTPMLELVDNKNIEISAQLSSSQANDLPNGNDIEFTTGNVINTVKLRAISSVINASQHTVEARLTFSDTRQAVGQSGRLQWSLPGRFLNTTYVQERNGTLGYFVLDGKLARFVPLDNVILGTPPRVSEEERRPIIHDGRHALVDGAPVTVVEAK